MYLQRLKLLLKLVFIVALLSYGFLYFSYKYYTPNLGGNDYFQYFSMYQSPFNFAVADSPFIYRQFHALVTNIILSLGIYYDNTISFVVGNENQRVHFASTLSNYLAIISCSILYFLFFIKNPHAIKNTDLMVSFGTLTASVLLLLAFNFMPTTLTGLSEGWAWFFILASYIALRRNKIFLFVPIVFLSVFQREMVAIIMAIITACYCLKDIKAYLNYFMASCAAFILYVCFRLYIFPVAGYEAQLSLSAQLENIASYIIPSKAVIFQGVLSQNLLILLALVYYSANKSVAKHYTHRISAVLLAILGVYIISAGSAIGANLGRMLALFNPIYALLIAEILVRTFSEREELSNRGVGHLKGAASV